MKSMKKNSKKSLRKELSHLMHSTRFAKYYLLGAFSILLASTILWSWHSAQIQQSNADQLVNSFLFENKVTFTQSQLPNQHSFLFKWPLFFIVKALHFHEVAFIAVTVLVCLVAVILMAWILRRFEKRPLYLGTILLALASVLLLVPAQPGPGGMIPVNMAMIATRNLEYVLYIACVATMTKVRNIKSSRFWLATLGLTVLFASDRFFVSISIAAALGVLFLYALHNRWSLVSFSVRWLAGGISAFLGSIFVLWLINQTRIAQIVGQNGASPYQSIHSIKSFILGVLYAFEGLLSNFGANPAYKTLTLKDVPVTAFHSLASSGGWGFLVNGAVFVAVFIAAVKLYRIIWKTKPSQYTNEQKLVVGLLASVVAALAAFVFTKHYYAGDARYLSISLFAGFMVLAYVSSTQHYQNKHLVLTGAVLISAIVSGALYVPVMNKTFINNAADVNARNLKVSHALMNHPAQTLLGDYWRVVPIRQISRQKNITPLMDCTKQRDILTSKNWQRDLTRQSFAYLLTLDKPLPDFPACNFTQVLQQFGRPSSTVLIAGDIKNPKELLLFYDQGAKLSSAISTLQAQSALLPIKPSQLPFTTCTTGLSTMNVVAHEDDDLLFMNPDILQSLKAGNCERTVFVTAGDAGSKFSWLKREQGSEAAYAQMLGVKNPLWIERVLELGEHQFVKVATLKGEPRVSLMFMHLPDGDLTGKGFAATAHQSLAQLNTDASVVSTVDGQSHYNKEQLVESLSKIMQLYQPSVVRTQSAVHSERFKDHSDHYETGRLATEAAEMYQITLGSETVRVPVTYYVGYPVREKPENVLGDVLSAKQAAFFAYARFDGAVCRNVKLCEKVATYDAYLKHQITSDY